MEQKIEFGVSSDGAHIVQRVSCGPIQTIVGIPLDQVDNVRRALQEAQRKAAGKVIVPGRRGIEFEDASKLAGRAAPEREDQREPA